MKNFSIVDKETGREYWISRSVAVLALVYIYDLADNEYILAVKRGEGTPDPEYVGCWCLPCGYLDFDETLNEAVSREVFEETGIKISPKLFKFWNINDNPKKDKRQNVTVRYFCTLTIPLEKLSFKLSNKFSEYKEVSDIKWIPTAEISNFKWAFNHEEIIKQAEEYY